MISIQLSNPEIVLTGSKRTSLIAAIEQLFPLQTEYAFLIWDHIFIPLSYKYDISFLIKDFILIHHFIKDEEQQSITIAWPSNTFHSEWTITKEANNQLRIIASWNCVLGDLEELLNERNEVTISSEQLNTEITRLVKFIRSVLEKAGYNAANLNEFSLLNL